MLHNSRDHILIRTGPAIKADPVFCFSKLNVPNYYARIAFKYFD
jgi:hypothetical protein